MNKYYLSALTLLGSAAIAVTTHAASINNTLFDGKQTLQDVSAESLIDRVVIQDDILDIGDSLRGILRIDSTQRASDDVTRSLLAGVNDSLTALFQVKVTGKEGFNGGSCLRVVCFNFGVDPDFVTEIEADYLGAGNGTGGMVLFFEDVVDDFNRIADGTISGAEATVTDGTPFWLAGFDGGIGEFWFAGADTDDVSLITAGGAQSAVGFNLGLSLIDALGNKELNEISCADGNPNGVNQTEFCGSGDLQQPEVGTGYDVYDSFRVTINAVPEPAALSLMGLGLLGLGAITRRKKRA